MLRRNDWAAKESCTGAATLQYGPGAQHWRDDSLQQMSAPTDAGYRNRRSKSTANPQGALHRPAAEWQNTFSDTHQLPHWPTPIGAMLSQARCLSTARVLFSLLARAHHVGTHVVWDLMAQRMRVCRRAVVCRATHEPSSPAEKNRNIAVADRLSRRL